MVGWWDGEVMGWWDGGMVWWCHGRMAGWWEAGMVGRWDGRMVGWRDCGSQLPAATRCLAVCCCLLHAACCGLLLLVLLLGVCCRLLIVACQVLQRRTSGSLTGSRTAGALGKCCVIHNDGMYQFKKIIPVRVDGRPLCYSIFGPTTFIPSA